MFVTLRTLGLIVSVVLFAAINVCRASAIAYDNDTTASNQALTDYSVGLSFTVNGEIAITSLGAFDSGNVALLNGNNGQGVTLGIYDNSTSALVAGSSTVTLTSASSVTTINGDSFISLVAPIVLGPGSYMVVAFDDVVYNYQFVSSSGLNPHSTENDGGGVISFLAPNHFLSTPSGIAYPTNAPLVTDTSSNQFMAGTFVFSPVPEPGALALATLGLCGLLVSARHCRGRRLPKAPARLRADRVATTNHADAIAMAE